MKKQSTTLNSLSDRLNLALSVTGTKKADLARSIDVKPQIIQYLCSSQTYTSRFTFEIATALGLSTRWLATGEGEMFVDNASEPGVLDSFRSIPLLDKKNIRDIFLLKKEVNPELISEWLPLKTDHLDIYAIEMIDSSMEPYFPMGSHLFIKICPEINLSECKFVFAYLNKFDTFVVREIIDTGSTKLLSPKNNDLFKEVSLNDDTNLVGIITDCHWHVRNK